MRVLMSCGGTGGHIYPAVAIAEILKDLEPGVEISFAGGIGGMEERIVEKEGYPFYGFRVEGLTRSASPRYWAGNLRALADAVRSPGKARSFLKRLQPDLVVGTGGYACWPALSAAAKLGIPVAVHESNVEPGLAVQKLSGHMSRIYVNFEETISRIQEPERVLRVGIPVRSRFATADRKSAREALGLKDGQTLILSFGGSGGAEYLNEAILKMMDGFSRHRPDILHIHAAGNRAGVYETMLASAKEKGLAEVPNIRILRFIDNMPDVMTAADIVISRAGAMTISELALSRKCSILVPSPYVAGQHQLKNAQALEQKGAARILYAKDERTFDGSEFIGEVESLLSNEKQMESMRENIASFVLPDANRRIGEDLLKILKNTS